MKKKSFSFIAAMITLALAGGAASAAGCGSVSTSALCQDICACQRCTSNDLETCEVDGDKASDNAAAAGCSSQFDELVTCAGAHVSCKEDEADIEGCDVEQAALKTCSSALGLFGQKANPCEEAADTIAAKFKACGVAPVSTTSGGGPMAECTDLAGTTSLCFAACIDKADCTLVKPDSANPPTAEQSKAYLDCATACQ